MAKELNTGYEVLYKHKESKRSVRGLNSLGAPGTHVYDFRDFFLAWDLEDFGVGLSRPLGTRWTYEDYLQVPRVREEVASTLGLSVADVELAVYLTLRWAHFSCDVYGAVPTVERLYHPDGTKGVGPGFDFTDLFFNLVVRATFWRNTLWYNILMPEHVFTYSKGKDYLYFDSRHRWCLEDYVDVHHVTGVRRWVAARWLDWLEDVFILSLQVHGAVNGTFRVVGHAHGFLVTEGEVPLAALEEACAYAGVRSFNMPEVSALKALSAFKVFENLPPNQIEAPRKVS